MYCPEPPVALATSSTWVLIFTFVSEGGCVICTASDSAAVAVRVDEKTTIKVRAISWRVIIFALNLDKVSPSTSFVFLVI